MTTKFIPVTLQDISSSGVVTNTPGAYLSVDRVTYFYPLSTDSTKTYILYAKTSTVNSAAIYDGAVADLVALINS
jgi:hypothetical protein